MQPNAMDWPESSAHPVTDPPPAASGSTDGPSVEPLARRLTLADPAQRAAVLLAAIAAGEQLELHGADLRGLDLRPGRATRGWAPHGPDVVPSPIRLDGADFSGATLCGACLAGVSLRGARMDGALLVGADLRQADLSGASLRSAHLTGANLARADLSFADLRGASLLTADLSDVTATGADLRETLLHAAVLVRAVLRAADLRWAHLEGANLGGAVLHGARLAGANLVLANLSWTRLSGSTDLRFALLHQARLDRSMLTRAHLGCGVGEEYTNLFDARDTYRGLKRHFASSGRAADARWAHGKARQMDTALHRPDRARRHDGSGRGRPARELPEAGGRTLAPATSIGSGPSWMLAARRRVTQVRNIWRSACFYARHGGLWLLGHGLALTTGYGTSFARTGGTLVATWLLFAGLFYQVGAVINLEGAPTGWLDALRYSAAALTPIDAYPLVATAGIARSLAVVEGLAGIILLGALGYVSASRMCHD